MRNCLAMFVGVLMAVEARGQEHKSRRPIPVFRESSALTLPSNATAIRENIVDNFSCENRIYGYYADVDNECQIFHVCLPQGRGSIRWSFICPLETVFNQATFVCTRPIDSILCEESEQYYNLNEQFGKEEPESTEEYPSYNDNDLENELPSVTPFSRRSKTRGRSERRGKSRQFNATASSDEATTSKQ